MAPFGTLFVVPAARLSAARNSGFVVDLRLTGDLPDIGLVARRLGKSPPVVCASPAYLAEPARR